MPNPKREEAPAFNGSSLEINQASKRREEEEEGKKKTAAAGGDDYGSSAQETRIIKRR